MENKQNTIKAIITGATGMVGEGVLQECLLDPQVESILVLNRKPCGITHEKLKEIIIPNFFELSGIESQLIDYNACFFCLGISSVGKQEPEFYHFTYELTMSVAHVLCDVNPKMTFCYVSGAGTDSSEIGRIMWARVKGKTENDLTRLPFKQVYNFRPGYLHPTKGLKNTHKFYKYLSWLYPVAKKFFPKYVSTLKELGLAMINVIKYGYDSKTIEVKDIHILAKK
jgi:hypothetical protein